MEHIHYYKDKTILITGGAGAIGSNLATVLLKAKPKLIIVLDNLSSSVQWNIPVSANLMFINGDITRDNDLEKAFKEKPEIIFHLAAFFANQRSLDYPEKDLMVNGMGILKLLEYSQKVGIKKFIYTSSSSIYGVKPHIVLKEELMTMYLDTPYQITKMLGELYCNFFYSYYRLPVVKTRIFNSYGPGELPGRYRNVIPNFIYQAIKGHPLSITGTGEETRNFTYIEDVIGGLLRAGCYQQAIGQEFNLASDKETKIIELAVMINKIVGNRAGINFTNKRKWDKKEKSLASFEKAMRILGYRPKEEFEHGLVKTIKWFRENWDKIEETVNIRNYGKKKD